MSGIDAVKRIVETEAQARKTVEEARHKAQDILTRASKDSETDRQEILAQAHQQREEILNRARTEAEGEAAKSDVDTDQTLANYQKAFQNKKDAAVEKALELILRG